MKKHFTVTLALVLLASALGAQTNETRPMPPKMKSPSEMAKEVTDRMQQEVALDKKQYKKVYKLFKKDFEYRQQKRQNGFPGGMPPQGGGPGGMGGPGGGMMGGGPGMGGGMMGGPGMGGGMMGGGPGMGGGMMGGPGGGMQAGERPEGGPGMGPGEDVVTEEYLERQDKKLKKILSARQYDQWREKHPAEHLELPPMELK